MIRKTVSFFLFYIIIIEILIFFLITETITKIKKVLDPNNRFKRKENRAPKAFKQESIESHIIPNDSFFSKAKESRRVGKLSKQEKVVLKPITTVQNGLQSREVSHKRYWEQFMSSKKEEFFRSLPQPHDPFESNLLWIQECRKHNDWKHLLNFD